MNNMFDVNELTKEEKDEWGVNTDITDTYGQYSNVKFKKQYCIKKDYWDKDVSKDGEYIDYDQYIIWE